MSPAPDPERLDMDAPSGHPSTSAGPPPFRPTARRSVSPGQAQASHASDYTALSRQVKDAGLLRRRPLSYALRVVVLTVGLAVASLLLVGVGRSWWQLLIAVLFSVLFTQTAFLAHDSAHKQVFTSARTGEVFSRVIGNAIVGLSYGWWVHKHTRHHGNPNTIGKDDDIRPGAVAFTPQGGPERTGLRGWLRQRQGYWFLPILALAGADLHRSAVRAILGKQKMQHRVQEGALITLRLIGFPLVVLLLLGPVLGIVFLVVQTASFGIYMGGTFAVNHTGMRVISRDEKVDYLRRQVLTSRNISGGRLMEHVMGGLNLQIEHHLFPNMPSANLRRLRPLVRQHCADLGIDYVEHTLPIAWYRVLLYVHRVGIRHADPFDCPAAGALRTA